jgi:hypothetical protein
MNKEMIQEIYAANNERYIERYKEIVNKNKV